MHSGNILHWILMVDVGNPMREYWKLEFFQHFCIIHGRIHWKGAHNSK